MRNHWLIHRCRNYGKSFKTTNHRLLKAVCAIAVCGGIGVGFAQDPFSTDRFSDSQQRFSDQGRSRFEPSSTRSKFNYFSRGGNRNEEENTNNQPTATSRSNSARQPGYSQQPQRYTRNSQKAPAPPSDQSKPALKNYHRALFGTPPRQTANLNPTNSLPRQRQTISPNDAGIPAESAIIPAGFDDQRRLPDPRQSNTPFSEQPISKQRTIQADFDRPQGDLERKNIRPIRATDQPQAPPFRTPAAIAKKSLKPAAPIKADPRRQRKTLPKLPDFPAKTPKAAAPQSDGLKRIAPKLPEPTQRAVPPVSQLPIRRTPRANATLPFSKTTAPQANFSQKTPAVTLNWERKGPINVGQECRCDLVVKNVSSVPAKNVEITAYFPTTVRLTSTKPVPAQATDHLTWNLPVLAAGEEKIIEINMIPSRRGEIATTANVRFTGTSSAAFQVDEPMLKVAMKGPEQVMVGDPASQIVTISNPGTGITENVTLEVHLPKGLEHIRGERLLMDVGSLNPGETRSVRLSLAAIEGGTHSVQVEVKGDAAISQSTKSQVTVISPSLKVAVDGPGLRYLGRNAAYTIMVANDGQIATNNVRVSQKVADGFEFISADRGGKYDPATRTINWFVGRLDSSQQTELKVRLTAKKIGEFQQFVQASSEHGARAQANAKTIIDGTASLILEIVDLDDPVEVGAETAYEIRVRNSGTKAAQKVGLSCELPAGVALISAKGPVKHIAENGMIVFKALPTLAPGKTALFRVHVRGSQAGNQRFRTRLTSDSVQEPLVVEELTKFYAD